MITIDPGYIQIGLTAALVSVTIIYAWRTHVISKAAKGQAEATRQQADASTKMAKEMKEQRMALARPRIILDVEVYERGEHFVKTIKVIVRNAGLAPAINTNLYIDHPTFEFSKPSKTENQTILVEGAIRRFFRLMSRDVDKDRDIVMKPDAKVVADYQDVYEKHWRSIQPFNWDAEKGELTIKPLKVAKRVKGTK